MLTWVYVKHATLLKLNRHFELQQVKTGNQDLQDDGKSS